VEVLGTHFNVNSYSDEALIKTTLLEGSIKVINGNSIALVKPSSRRRFQIILRQMGTLR